MAPSTHLRHPHEGPSVGVHYHRGWVSVFIKVSLYGLEPRHAVQPCTILQGKCSILASMVNSMLGARMPARH
jgi:hypothetical protein